MTKIVSEKKNETILIFKIYVIVYFKSTTKSIRYVPVISHLGVRGKRIRSSRPKIENPFSIHNSYNKGRIVKHATSL